MARLFNKDDRVKVVKDNFKGTEQGLDNYGVSIGDKGVVRNNEVVNASSTPCPIYVEMDNGVDLCFGEDELEKMENE